MELKKIIIIELFDFKQDTDAWMVKAMLKNKQTNKKHSSFFF